jgi:[methyl-Co(III) methanol-specific corrinoid protein]:coenzyme M methyltransferase
VLKNADEMTEAAISNLELGFESTVVPFDMNVEAEIIGCPVLFHEEVEGVPVYPTVGERWIQTTDDFDPPDYLAGAGRIPAIAAAIKQVKSKAAGRAAVGAFVPGPFTLAGQVMEPDRMFVAVLKRPEATGAVINKLTELLIRVRDVYVEAGVDYVVVEEGGATNISPKAFGSMVLPMLKRLFEGRKVPHILSLAGRSEQYVPMMVETGADGLGVDQECDLEQSLQRLPAGFPLLAICGTYDMLANGTPEQVRDTVWACLDRGVTQASPPADIYPPARLENIEAFVEAHKFYQRRNT